MSNTTDPFVPALSRHTFTKKPSAEQPVFSHADKEAFTKTWDEYILVEKDITNAQLLVSADDNASAYLYAFPDKIAEVTPLTEDKDYGGGQFRPCDPIPVIAELKRGYYRIHIQYENVNYPGTNAARLEVKLNDKQVVIGDLIAHNLLTKVAAEMLTNHYVPYSYSKKSTDEVYAAIGGWLNDNHNSDDPETAANYYHSCALRLSIALSAFGQNLAGATGADNILTGASNILGGNRHVIISSSNMAKHIKSEYGSIEYPAGDYTAESKIEDMKKIKINDIYLYSDSTHSGLSTGTEDLGNYMSGDTWLLYRDGWANPENK